MRFLYFLLYDSKSVYTGRTVTNFEINSVEYVYCRLDF